MIADAAGCEMNGVEIMWRRRLDLSRPYSIVDNLKKKLSLMLLLLIMVMMMTMTVTIIGSKCHCFAIALITNPSPVMGKSQIKPQVQITNHLQK